MADDATASAQDLALGGEGVTDISALDQGTLPTRPSPSTPPLVAAQHGRNSSRLQRL